MALALTLTPGVSARVGKPIKVTGTGFTAAGQVRLRIYGCDTNLSVSPVLTASGGAITTVDKVEIVPWKSGVLRVEAHDITAGTKITKSVKVSAGT